MATHGKSIGTKVEQDGGSVGGPSHAFLDGDAVVLTGFRETDPQVVSLVRDTEDVEATIHNCLEVGARAINLAQVSMDSQLVEHAFDEMKGELTHEIENAVGEIKAAGEALLDEENGELAGVLAQWREDVDKALGDTFDPDSKRSVIGKIEAVLNSAREAQVDAFKKVIDPTDEASPLGRYNAQLTKVVKDEVSSLRTAVNEVSEKIAVRSAEAELLEKTTIKGASFEELVHGVVSGLAAAHGDIAEETGGKSGATGGKVGDEVVTINTEDTRGAAARYTLECKDRKRGLDGILDELDEALKNREACAAIAVFSCEAYSPCATPFAYFGNRAIVVLDKNEPDDRALRLALMWARWVTRRQLAEASETVDVDQIERIVGDASRALDRVATIRRCHSSARNKIDEAGKQVTDLAGDVENALERVREELRA